jgi:hypothetical protein
MHIILKHADDDCNYNVNDSESYMRVASTARELKARAINVVTSTMRSPLFAFIHSYTFTCK